MPAAPRFLFLPVSGGRGVGEYMRCLTLAQGVQQRWPRADIRFVLSEQVPYLADVPFPVHTLERSPTFHVAEVKALLAELRPHVAIFDSAGRTPQFRAARRLGLGLVYISSRPKNRRRGFRFKWLRLLDQHWIAQPTFVDGPLTRWESRKCRLAGAEPLFLEALFPPSEPARRAALLARLGLGEKPFLLFCAGGGGKRGDGKQAPEIFAEAASALVAEGQQAVLVLGPNYAGPLPVVPGLVVERALPNVEMIDLMAAAELLVINGGSMVAQGLALGKAVVSVPVGADQQRRIDACTAAGLVRPARLESSDIAKQTKSLLAPAARQPLLDAVAAAGIRNGLDVAMDGLARLLEAVPSRGGRPE